MIKSVDRLIQTFQDVGTCLRLAELEFGTTANNLTASARFNYENLDFSQGHFDRVLIGLRVAYAFTPSLYLQSLTQWNDQTKSFSANIRFGWLGPAGTGLFVVYNEGRETGDQSRLLQRAFLVKFTRQFIFGQ